MATPRKGDPRCRVAISVTGFVKHRGRHGLPLRMRHFEALDQQVTGVVVELGNLGEGMLVVAQRLVQGGLHCQGDIAAREERAKAGAEAEARKREKEELRRDTV